MSWALAEGGICKIASTSASAPDRVSAGVGARDIHVQFSDVDVVVEQDQAFVTFTRTDEFTDTRTGRDVRMDIRANSVLQRIGGAWRVQGLKSAATQ